MASAKNHLVILKYMTWNSDIRIKKIELFTKKVVNY